MKKFIAVFMFVVAFVGFSGTSEAGPLRNLVNRVQHRQFRPVQTVVHRTTNVVSNVRPGWVVPKVVYLPEVVARPVSVQSSPVVNNTVWSTPSNGQTFQTPLRNAVYNVFGSQTCTNCHNR